MRAIVTGAAGFIGSHLCEHLLDHGDEVVGVDSLTDHYDPRRKEANLAALRARDGFTDHRLDLNTTPLQSIFARADVVYHLAGQPGVRGSWGEHFAAHVSRNIGATQRVLEAARETGLWKVVYASSASVYGATEVRPTGEEICPAPVSSYGVTTMAAEQLCELYRATYGVSTVSLRLFTVYGPRQRPDMALPRLVDAALQQTPFLVYGGGERSRDFVYVADVVAAMRQAALSPWTGVANIGTGTSTTLDQLIDAVSETVGPVDVVHLPALPGDVPHTQAEVDRAHRCLGFSPRVRLLPDGLARMVAAHRDFVTETGAENSA